MPRIAERTEGTGAAPEGARCHHCGLPVPAILVEPAAGTQFCCEGCRVVYAVLHEHGLEHYYRLRDSSAERAGPARPSGGGFEQFDDETFHELYVRPAGNGLSAVELYLEGVHCAACVWLVEKVPVIVPGVAEVRLDLPHQLARVTWDASSTPLSVVARFLDSLGYAPHPYRGVDVRAMRRREERSLLIRLAVAGACAGNVMTMGFALYGGMLHGMEDGYQTLFRWASLIVTLPAVVWSAAVFYRGAWGSLRARRLHMDLPITVGIVAGFLWGTANTVRGVGEIYFDSVTALVFLLLAGRYIQQRRQRSATDAAELLFSLTPSSARIVDEGGTRTAPVEAVREGMHVSIAAGESVPVDGIVDSGRSEIDLSLLSGESRPVAVGPGDPVHAGTLNLTSPIEIRVAATGENTRVGRLMRMVEEGARRRAPIVRLADRISGAFVAVVLALAALTVGLWWSSGPERAVDHAIALLIVTCPCALGLATPLAVTAAIGRAGKTGILIKGGDALERLARPGRLFLDKTGTLTEGRARLLRWSGSDAARADVLAVEARIAHPVARALVEGLGGAGEARHAEAERSADGAGVVGSVDGRRVLVGSPAWVESRVGPLPPALAEQVRSHANEGLTPVGVAIDGRAVAVAGIGNALRADAAETVAALRAAGWRVSILSGDHPSVVAAAAERLGVPAEDAHGAVDPEGKLRAIERAGTEGTVVMVGDGINDAAALSAAGVGVAIEGGAEVAMSVADVFLSGGELGRLRHLLEGARRTMTVIRRNLAFSLLYNVVGAALAMAGWINPLLAAVLMPLSSLTVITHSFRARGRFDVGVIYIVLPLALLIAGIALLVFIRAARSGQFDDLDTPGLRMLHDDDPGRRCSTTAEDGRPGERGPGDPGSGAGKSAGARAGPREPDR